MEYCFIAGNYPTKDRQVHVFLENVVVKLVDRGEKCNVIAPQSLVTYFFKKKNRRPIAEQRKTAKGNSYRVYSPVYFIFPKKKIGKFYMQSLNILMIYNAIKRTYKKNKLNANLIYSHFIKSGIAGVKLAKYLGIPSFIANGEADTIASLNDCNPFEVEKTLENVTGIISVSTKNKNEIVQLVNNKNTIVKKISVIVNAVDTNKFYKKNRMELRKKLGFPTDKFIVAFTGSFIERKGVLRLANAIDKFDDVFSIFMGVGEQIPQCKNILHCGRVNNKELSDYLNAADVFVLPTQAEGCSNAIVEAVACGLPVISSDLEFNYDVLDKDCAILIDPNDEEKIEKSIRLLKENIELRKKLGEGAMKKALNLSLDVRVDRIQDFINSKIQI